MFTLSDSPVFEDHIPSTWRIGKGKKDKETQHKGVETKDQSHQTDKKETKDVSIDVQTHEIGVGSEQKVEIDDATVATFLSNVAPLMIKELSSNLSNSILDDYVTALEEETQDAQRTFSLLHTDVHAPEPEEAKNRKGRHLQPMSSFGPASCLVWNCRGNTVAVAFGRQEHQGWCNHRSVFTYWNVLKRQMRLDAGDRAFETPCCIGCMDFHPERPSIIAIGLYNGEVRLYDLSSDSRPLLCTSQTDDYYHREEITDMQWVRDFNTTQRLSYMLCSVSSDGKVLFWSHTNKLAWPKAGGYLKPTRKYHGQGTKMNRYDFMGGTALGFSALDYQNYVVGTEAGGVLKCAQSSELRGINKKYIKSRSGEMKWSIDAARLLQASANHVHIRQRAEAYAKAKGSKDKPAVEGEHIFLSRPDLDKIWKNPAKNAFKPHAGPVTAIACSPFHRNIFLTCSTDASVHLMNMFSEQPVLYFEPGQNADYIFSLAWSPSRPLVFACAGSKGMVYIYDLLEDMINPVVTFKANTDQMTVTSLTWNTFEKDLLATSDAGGRVVVWRVGPQLVKEKKGEHAMMQMLGRSGQAI